MPRSPPSLTGTLSLSRSNAFFLGVAVVNDAEVTHGHLDGDRFIHLAARIGGETLRIEARAETLASGGFQSDLD